MPTVCTKKNFQPEILIYKSNLNLSNSLWCVGRSSSEDEQQRARFLEDVSLKLFKDMCRQKTSPTAPTSLTSLSLSLRAASISLMNQALLLLGLPPLELDDGGVAAEAEGDGFSHIGNDASLSSINVDPAGSDENEQLEATSPRDSLEEDLQSPLSDSSILIEDAKVKEIEGSDRQVNQLSDAGPSTHAEGKGSDDSRKERLDQEPAYHQNTQDHHKDKSCQSSSSTSPSSLGIRLAQSSLNTSKNDENITCSENFSSSLFTEPKLEIQKDFAKSCMTVEEPAKAATFPRTSARKTAASKAVRRGKRMTLKKHVGLTLSREELKAATWPEMTAEAEQRLASDDCQGVVGSVDEPEGLPNVDDFEEQCLDDLSIATHGGNLHDASVNGDFDNASTHPFHPHHRRTLPIFSIREIAADDEHASGGGGGGDVHALPSVPEDGESEDEPHSSDDHVCCLCDGSADTEDSDLLDEPIENQHALENPMENQQVLDGLTENQAVLQEATSSTSPMSESTNPTSTDDRNSITQSSSLDTTSEDSSFNQQSSKPSGTVERSCTTISSSEATSDISDLKSSSEASPTVDRSCTTKSSLESSSCLKSTQATADSQSVADASSGLKSSSSEGEEGVCFSDKQSAMSNFTNSSHASPAPLPGSSAVAGKLLAAGQSGARWPTVDRNASTASSIQATPQSSVGESEKASSASEGPERSRGSGSKSGRASNRVELVPKGGRGVEQLLHSYKPFHDKEVYSEFLFSSCSLIIKFM